MDQAAKVLTQLVIIFLGVFLLLSVVSFCLVSSGARSALNDVVDYIETNGYNEAVEETIAKYGNRANYVFAVTPIENEEGILGNNNQIRYEVTVSFKHIFSWIRLEKRITYKAYTRVMEY